jgi:hypothetical protein
MEVIMDEPVKGFIISNEAWYCQQPETRLPEDDIVIGKYFKDGSCIGEFAVVFEEIAPKLEIYNDAFKLLSDMPEFISTISTLENNFTPKDLSEALLDIGYVDLTERELNNYKECLI